LVEPLQRVDERRTVGIGCFGRRRGRFVRLEGEVCVPRIPFRRAGVGRFERQVRLVGREGVVDDITPYGRVGIGRAEHLRRGRVGIQS
jgi:hypothetical protein